MKKVEAMAMDITDQLVQSLTMFRGFNLTCGSISI